MPDANFDFELFKRRASICRMGPEDEVIEGILENLELPHDECRRRGELLVDMEEPEATRKIADKDHRLHPVLCLLEEAHAAFGHAKYGKDISKLAIDNVKICRKRAIHMILSTQAPTKDSNPRDVTRNCTATGSRSRSATTSRTTRCSDRARTRQGTVRPS